MSDETTASIKPLAPQTDRRLVMANNVHVRADERRTSTFLGMDNHVLLGAGQTDGLLGVVDISVQPGAGSPPHTNTREALMWYGIAGTIVFDTENGPEALSPGDAVFLPKGGTHAFTNTSDREARALVLCLPGGFEDFLLELSGKLPTEVPAGPPTPESFETLVTTAARYDVVVQSPTPR
jgi:quercetin dioxygenase-like cupin family protein